MPKTLRCTDIIPGCDFVARGESEDEVLARAAEHARTRHHLRAITPEILAHVRAAIREEKPSGAKGATAA
jgi:predicted small metal-binding protein